MLSRRFINRNLTFISILVFLSAFVLVQYLEPSFLYNKDGSLRDFGLNSKHKTILPIWLITIILAMLSYLGVLYYVTYPKIQY